jgi:lysophospholipase L1-like esterase
VIGATITPRSDSGWQAYDEQARNAVNFWIRHSGVFDAVADFDVVVRDPSNPSRLRPEYDAGDHLHLNPVGLQALADSVDLAQLS